MASSSAADDATQLATAGSAAARTAEDRSPSPQPWRPSQVSTGGRYEVRRQLGRGGMGEVSLALDRDIDRQIAVKRLLGDSPAAVARFVDEVRIVGQLEHPNIAPVHDVGIDEAGRMFFVMKYVEGDTVRRIIERLAAGDPEYHARYVFDRRLDIFAGIVRALQYAHSRGIVHRDVKPDNIIVGPCGEVMLMDWGIARVMGRPDEESARSTPAIRRISDETVDGSLLGTLRYMSPEQLAGRVQELDGRSDLYSAFAVFYELLTLRAFVDLPADSSPISVATMDRPPPPVTGPRWQHPGQHAVPTELRHFVRRGLREDVAQRPAHAALVLDELHAIRNGDARIQCPVTAQRRMIVTYQRMLDRWPVIALMPLAALLAILVSTVVFALS